MRWRHTENTAFLKARCSLYGDCLDATRGVWEGLTMFLTSLPLSILKSEKNKPESLIRYIGYQYDK